MKKTPIGSSPKKSAKFSGALEPETTKQQLDSILSRSVDDKRTIRTFIKFLHKSTDTGALLEHYAQLQKEGWKRARGWANGPPPWLKGGIAIDSPGAGAKYPKAFRRHRNLIQMRRLWEWLTGVVHLPSDRLSIDLAALTGFAAGIAYERSNQTRAGRTISSALAKEIAKQCAALESSLGRLPKPNELWRSLPNMERTPGKPYTVHAIEKVITEHLRVRRLK